MTHLCCLPNIFGMRINHRPAGKASIVVCQRWYNHRKLPMPHTRTTYSSTSALVAVDLFCGAGGLSYGLKEAGIHIAGGIDIDPACQHPFETNIDSSFTLMDVNKLSADTLNAFYPEGSQRILVGCAPCQPFSSYSNRRIDESEEWSLLKKFSSLIRETTPDIVTMENVPQLENYSIFTDFLTTLDELNYKRSVRVIRCSNYGVPQLRRRLVVLASMVGEIRMIDGKGDDAPLPTVREAIGNLPRITAGGTSDDDPLHRSSGLSERNLERIQNSVPGGTWRDWDEDLRARCHIKDSGRTYSSVYGRMEWDKPGPTITTQFHGFGNGRFGHPDQDRAISLREGALLQTFPPEYSFISDTDTIYMSRMARLIGNAVPVKLGEAIGRSIVQHLESVP